MSSKDFLDRMRKIGDEHGRKGGSGFITQMTIEFGFWVYVKDHDRLAFWKRCEDPKEAETIKAEIQARLAEQNINEEPDYCLRMFASKDVLGDNAPDWVKEWDKDEFYGRWQWDKQKDGPETCYTLIINSVEKNNLPFGTKFWGRYISKPNPYYVAQGEAGKKPSKKDPTKSYFPSFTLPVEIFADEAAARLVAGGGSSTTTDSQWSDTVRREYSDPSKFASAGNINSIHAAYLKIKAGELPYPGAPALPEPLTSLGQKQYLATMYDCETDDVDLVLDMTPF